MSQIYATTPVGRWVQGDLWTPQATGYQNKPIVDKQGNPKDQWYVGLAVPKGAEFDAFWAQVVAKAQTDWPQGEWQRQPPGFSWKIVDGDAPDQNAKEGHAGHWILRLTSGFAPTVYDSAHNQIIDPNLARRGDYLRVSVGVQGNGDFQKPGIYLNLGSAQFAGEGQRIITGPSPQEAFGTPTTAPAVTALPGTGGAAATALPGTGGATATALPGTAAATATEGSGFLTPGLPER